MAECEAVVGRASAGTAINATAAQGGGANVNNLS